MDNKNNIEQFDDLFKQAFDKASATPPPGVWEAVSAGTSAATTAVGTSVIAKLVGVKAAAILGSVALVVTTLVVLNQDDSKLSNSDDNSSIVQNEELVIDDNKASAELDQTGSKVVVDSSVDEGAGENIISEIQENSKSNTGENIIKYERNNDGEITYPTDVQDGLNKTDQALYDVDPVQSGFNVELKPSNATVCVNSSVSMSLISPEKVASLVWLLDGKLISTEGLTQTILMVAPGQHKITVSGKTLSGYKFNKDHTVTVTSASAEFQISDLGNGAIDLVSNRAVAKSQWYANQVLIGENKRELIYNTSQTEVQFVHMVTDVQGCRDTAVQNFKAKDQCDFKIYIRDAITPYLLDGKNDELEIEMPEVENFHFTVYDPSNAKVIFDTNNPQIGWNGKYENIGALVPVGQYVYRLIYDCGGKTFTKRGKVEVKD